MKKILLPALFVALALPLAAAEPAKPAAAKVTATFYINEV